MNRQILISLIRYLCTGTGLILFCLPALLSMDVHTYRYFICFGIITASMAVLLPLLLKEAGRKQRSFSYRVKYRYTALQKKAA